MTGHVLKKKILVKQDEAKNVTKEGIIIPTKYAEPPLQGTVIVAGDESEVGVGDRVVFAEHAGTQVQLNEEDLSLEGDYILLDNQHVLFYKTK